MFVLVQFCVGFFCCWDAEEVLLLRGRLHHFASVTKKVVPELLGTYDNYTQQIQRVDFARAALLQKILWTCREGFHAIAFPQKLSALKSRYDVYSLSLLSLSLYARRV